LSKLGNSNVMVGPQPCTGFSMPDYKKIPQLKVRQALAFAYPYEDAWAAGGDIPGVTLANGVTNPDLGFGILPPGMAGREVVSPVIDGETIKYDPAHAKKLLQEAGFAPGEFEASWAYDASTPEGKAAMEQTKKGYEAAGFKAKAYPYTGGSLYDIWTDPENAIHKKINIMGTAWCQDWASGATFIPPLLETGGAYNTGAFSEPEVDNQIKAIHSKPIDQQPAAWGALDKLIMDKYFPVINRGYYQNIFAFGTKVGGFENDTSTGGFPNIEDLFVKQ
jgi:ABC-type transport system substrate-binding protein